MILHVIITKVVEGGFLYLASSDLFTRHDFSLQRAECYQLNYVI